MTRNLSKERSKENSKNQGHPTWKRPQTSVNRLQTQVPSIRNRKTGKKGEMPEKMRRRGGDILPIPASSPVMKFLTNLRAEGKIFITAYIECGIGNCIVVQCSGGGGSSGVLPHAHSWRWKWEELHKLHPPIIIYSSFHYCIKKKQVVKWL